MAIVGDNKLFTAWLLAASLTGESLHSIDNHNCDELPTYVHIPSQVSSLHRAPSPNNNSLVVTMIASLRVFSCVLVDGP